MKDQIQMESEMDSRPVTTQQFQKVNIAESGFSILQIETKASCNMACEFCPYPLRASKKDVLPSEIFYALVASLQIDKNFEYVALSQFNEPLMDERIYEFIRHLKDKKIPVMITTNGLLFSKDKVVKELLAASPDYIKLSLQTLNARIFSRSRGIHYPFEDYKAGILKFLENAAHGLITITVDLACNFVSPMKSLRNKVLGLEKGDPSVYNTVFDLKDDLMGFLKEWESVLPSFALDEKKIQKFLEDVDNAYLDQKGLKIADNICIKIKPFWYGHRIKEFLPVGKTKGCHDRILGVLASGDVVPCCLAYDNVVSLGNIKEKTLQEILESRKDFISRLREGKNMPRACRRCLGAPTWRGALVKTMKNLLGS